MTEIGIYLNRDKKESSEMAKKCIAYLKKKGMVVALLENQLDDFDAEGVVCYSKELFFKEPDCIVVLGGDGTLLSVARRSCIYNMPLFGINLGKLGFLTEGEASNYASLLEVLCNGGSYLEKRMMLNCIIFREDGREEHYLALNDVLIKNAGFRMMELRAYVCDDVMDIFRADGLIIATPTGSTAYSLAAGGPVVAPGTDVMIVNPVCPHRLHDRAYVISAEEDIHIRFDERERDIIVSIDGQTIVPISPKDEVVIERALYTTNLIRLNGISFYDRLRKKLSDDALYEEDRR